MISGGPRHSFPAEGVGEEKRFLIPRTFESLKNPNYRLFWIAMIGQQAAMNMEMVARPWFIYALTKSPALLGIAGLVQAIPMLAFSLFGGVIADRVPKKYVLLLGEVGSAMVALGIALAISFGVITWVHLIALGFLRGIVFALMSPSRQAIVPELVGEERLMNAVALTTAGMNINRFLAPAAAGFIIAKVGIEAIYYLEAGLYLFASLLLFLLPRTGAISIGGGGALAQMKGGVQYIRKNDIVFTILLVTLGSVLLSMPYMQLLPVFTEDVLKIGPEGLGVLMSVSGIGALAGSIIIASLGSQHRGMLFLHSLLISGVALLAFSFSHWYTFSLAVIILVGLGQAGRMALSTILLQAYSEEAYRGRVMSIYMMEFGLTSFGTFGVAILAQFIGVQWAVGGTSALLIALALYCYALIPRLRHLD